MEAIDNSTRSIGDSVNETTMLADEVARSADSGSELVGETATSMSKIKDAIKETNNEMVRRERRDESNAFRASWSSIIDGVKSSTVSAGT